MCKKCWSRGSIRFWMGRWWRKKLKKRKKKSNISCHRKRINRKLGGVLERLGKKRRYTKEEWRGRLINCVYIRSSCVYAHACWCSDPKTGLQVALCVIRGGRRGSWVHFTPRSLDSFCTCENTGEATWVPPISSPLFSHSRCPWNISPVGWLCFWSGLPAHHHCLFLFLSLSVRACILPP